MNTLVFIYPLPELGLKEVGLAQGQDHPKLDSQYRAVLLAERFLGSHATHF